MLKSLFMPCCAIVQQGILCLTHAMTAMLCHSELPWLYFGRDGIKIFHYFACAKMDATAQHGKLPL